MSLKANATQNLQPLKQTSLLKSPKAKESKPDESKDTKLIEDSLFSAEGKTRSGEKGGATLANKDSDELFDPKAFAKGGNINQESTAKEPREAREAAEPSYNAKQSHFSTRTAKTKGTGKRSGP